MQFAAPLFLEQKNTKFGYGFAAGARGNSVTSDRLKIWQFSFANQ